MTPSSAAARTLQDARRDAGLSQEELAERCHVSARTIRSLESGVAKRPHRETLIAIARALGMSPAGSDAFVASWRRGRRTRTIAELFQDRPPEQALFEELERQRSRIREQVVSCVITIGADRRWQQMVVRRTFEIVDENFEHFLIVISFPTGQLGASEPREIVAADLLDTIDVPQAGGRAFLLGLTAAASTRGTYTLGYGITYGAVDPDSTVTSDDESLFAVSSGLTFLSQEIRFDPRAVPARACRIQGDTVDGTLTSTNELPISPAGVVCSVDLPASPGVHGIRWEWD